MVGRTVGFGRYQLLGLLGRGGMGSVYEAEQLNMRRRVAFKVLDPALTRQPDFVERFHREVETIAHLEHPNILPVYDSGEDDDGMLYLVMLLVRGGTLKDRLHREPPPWPARQVLKLAQQVLAALDAAHQQGIIHRDIKPDNILLHGERALLADFGIAKLMQGDPGLTVVGTFVGTPDYAAPEQVLALPLDGRSDLYAFGIVLYELLTGRVPYRADTPMGVALQHVQGLLPPPWELNPNLPLPIARVLMRALAREREGRYATGPELAEALEAAIAEAERAQSDSGSVAPTPVTGQPYVHPAAQRPTVAQMPGVPNLAEPTVIDPEPHLAVTRERERLEAEARERERLEAEAALAAHEQARLEAEARERERLQAEARERERAEAAAVAARERERLAAEARERERLVAESRERARLEAEARERERVAAAALAARERERRLADRRERELAAAAPAGATPSQAGMAEPVLARISRQPLLFGGGAAVVLLLVALLVVVPRLGSTPEPAISPTATTPAALAPPAPTAKPAVATANPAAPTTAPAVAAPTAAPTRAPTAAPTPAPTRPAVAVAPPVKLADARYGQTATELNTGKVLLVGGKGASGPLLSAELYDPAANTITSAGTTAVAHANGTATLLPDGKVLVVGGESSDTLFTSVAELYDPATNAWIPAGQLATDRAQHTATLLANGHVLISGGHNDKDFLASAELYDPATNSWAAAAAMANPHSNHTATLLDDGRVLIAGGFASEKTSEVYDPAANIWRSAGALVNARLGHTATRLANGKVLVAGGSSSSSAGYLASAELFDPATNRWTAAANLNHPRGGHTATLLRDGQVLVVGGKDNTQVLASAERYEPANNRWVDAAPPGIARWLHTAVLLTGPQVLVAGGKGDTDPLVSMERYEPAANRWVTSSP